MSITIETAVNSRSKIGEEPGAIARRDAGGLVLSAKSGFYLYDPAQPEAGNLFAITGLGITGLPQTRFAG